MLNYNTLNGNLKRGILNYSQKISKGLNRPDKKFVTDMLYGTLASGSCMLSEISRSLHENIKLIKTVNRLSRNLADFEAADAETVRENYLKAIKRRYNDDSLIIVDGSDITKPASKHLEKLCEVRDGSTGEIRIGYHTIGAAVLSSENKLPFGIYSRIYSTKDEDFVSEIEEYLDCFEYISRHFSKDNVRTMDRGFDNNKYYRYFIRNNEKFIIRAKKNRNVIYNGKTENIMSVANRFKGKYSLRFKNKSGKQVDVKISIISIQLPKYKNVELQLVVVYGFGEEPMLLITNLSSDDKRIGISVCKAYLMRWRIEEYFKFKKQKFDYENLRVRSLQSIRTLDLLLTLAIGYISMLSDKPFFTRMRFEIIEVSKRLFGAPDFVYYAIADGIYETLKYVKSGLKRLLAIPTPSPQLLLAGFGET